MILAPLIGNSDSHILKSTRFSSFMDLQILSSDDVLVSFDVVSLFSNVPVNLAIDVPYRRLQTDDSLASRTNLSLVGLTQLLEFCLNGTY